jgi:membrane protein
MAAKSPLTATFQVISKSVSRFMDDDGTTMAAALAYYTTFSIAPLLLIVISIVGFVFGRQVVQGLFSTKSKPKSKASLAKDQRPRSAAW